MQALCVRQKWCSSAKSPACTQDSAATNVTAMRLSCTRTGQLYTGDQDTLSIGQCVHA